MARTSNVFARIEPETKRQAEIVLDKLGIPMSNAIDMFLKQVVLQRGIPFDVRLPINKPLAYEALSREQFDLQMEKGFSDYTGGKTCDAAVAFDAIEQEKGL